MRKNLLVKFETFTSDQGLEEKYTTTGNGNLSISYKYKKTTNNTTTVRRGEVLIDQYLLISFENYVDDVQNVNFKLALNEANLDIPTE